MCSVVGYVGQKGSWKFVSQALERLEYRGYDSAGFACIIPGESRVGHVKVTGHVQRLLEKYALAPIDGPTGIGHTRWATHGKLSEENSHPHINETCTIALVHNGIIENHHALREQLTKCGHTFCSQTDSEVIVHCFEQACAQHKLLKDAVAALVQQLEGSFALVILNHAYPETLVAIRKGSPLCIGVGTHEFFVASDPIAFAGHTHKTLFLADATFAIIQPDTLALFDFAGQRLNHTFETIDLTWEGKGSGFESYMLKEIFEQKHVIEGIIAFYKSLHAQNNFWSATGLLPQTLQDTQAITIFASGSSWHAAQIGQHFFELIARIQTRALLASEARYMPLFAQEKELYIALSQSGETADVLEALRLLSASTVSTLAITNSASSSLVRETDGFLLLKAGQEISVGSTKSFTAQVALLYLLAHYIAFERGLIQQEHIEAAYKELFRAAQVLELAIDRHKHDIMQKHAAHYAQYDKFLLIGRHVSYAFALEAALKIKEITYQFAQCHPAGELKHGPFALIDQTTPIILFSHTDELIYKKLLLSAQEIKARNGHILAFGFENQYELEELSDCFLAAPRVPPLLVPIALAGLMQIFVYYIAKQLKRPIDQPRNLAKSVTVE